MNTGKTDLRGALRAPDGIALLLGMECARQQLQMHSGVARQTRKMEIAPKPCCEEINQETGKRAASATASGNIPRSYKR